MVLTGTLGAPAHSMSFTPKLGLLLPDVTVPWWEVYTDSLVYLPIVLPFALATVVGGIDCTESAAAAGDEYHTGLVIAVEGVATIAAGLCGGVIQTTPYIGHPAYKAMGGRSAYVLATALFVGGAGMLGYFGFLYQWIPQPAIYPVLVFIGLEITSQSYHATKYEHYPAVAISCMPALAYLITIYTDQILGGVGKSIGDFAEINPVLARNLQTLRILAGGGSFILTGLLWSSGLAAIIDRKLRWAAAFFAVAAVCSLFGVIHSPAVGGVLVLPWDLPTSLPAELMAGQTPYYLAIAYGAMATVLAVWGGFVTPAVEETDRPSHADA
jgi:AGZA family xanthine/uracil permease-like MFS transporter